MISSFNVPVSIMEWDRMRSKIDRCSLPKLNLWKLKQPAWLCVYVTTKIRFSRITRSAQIPIAPKIYRRGRFAETISSKRTVYRWKRFVRSRCKFARMSCSISFVHVSEISRLDEDVYAHFAKKVPTFHKRDENSAQ